MFLFIASEAMLFGAFFTAYFFVRVVNPEAQAWPLPPFHLPVFVAGVNTAVLLTSSFTMHWALQSIKRGNRAGMKAGLVLTLLMGLAFLLTQMLEYARIGFNPSDGAFGTIFFGLTGLHGAHVFVGLTLLTIATVRCLPRPFHPGAPPRRRDPWNLLALRRRNVDRGVRDDLPALAMARNPFRSEAEAYRFLLLTVGYFALIVAAAAIETWLGLVVFVVLTAAAIWFWMRSRSNEPVMKASVPQVGSDDERRILVIANETVGGDELLAILRRKAEGIQRADPRRLPGAQLAGAALGLGRGRCSRCRPGAARREPRAASARRRPGAKARSGTAIRCRRWRTRCAHSAPTRS